MYRYFHNDQGTIVGYCQFANQCFTTQMVHSTGYVDDLELIDIQTHQVDINSHLIIIKSN